MSAGSLRSGQTSRVPAPVGRIGSAGNSSAGGDPNEAADDDQVRSSATASLMISSDTPCRLRLSMSATTGGRRFSRERARPLHWIRSRSHRRLEERQQRPRTRARAAQREASSLARGGDGGRTPSLRRRRAGDVGGHRAPRSLPRRRQKDADLERSRRDQGLTHRAAEDRPCAAPVGCRRAEHQEARRYDVAGLTFVRDRKRASLLQPGRRVRRGGESHARSLAARRSSPARSERPDARDLRGTHALRVRSDRLRRRGQGGHECGGPGGEDRWRAREPRAGAAGRDLAGGGGCGARRL